MNIYEVLSFGEIRKKVLSQGCSNQVKLNTNSGNSFKCSHLDEALKKVLRSDCSDIAEIKKGAQLMVLRSPKI